MRTKLSYLLDAMAREEWTKALSIASKFHDLGEHKVTITRAHGCIMNPQFYAQVGVNPAEAIELGKQALIERYN
jgi:hypothetical protein